MERRILGQEGEAELFEELVVFVPRIVGGFFEGDELAVGVLEIDRFLSHGGADVA